MLNLIQRGYQIGGGMLSPDGKIFWLSIPKNASTFISAVLHQNNWEYSNLCYFTGDKVLCAIRDPVERWISGMSTYSALYLLNEHYGSDQFVKDYNQLTERLIFDNIVFDDHTTPQIDFISLIPKDKKIVYLSADNHCLLDNLSKYIGTPLSYDPSITNENSSENNYDTKKIKEFLESRVTEHIEEKLKIKFSQDYQLLHYVSR